MSFHSYQNSQLDVMFLVAFLVLTIIKSKSLRLSYTTYAISLAILILSSGKLTSTPRYLAISFPTYLALATIKSSLIRKLVKYTFIATASLFTILYSNWYWIA